MQNYQVYTISQRSQLYFSRPQFKSSFNPKNLKSYSLSLLKEISYIMQLMPRRFKITTKNGSGTFNTDFLIETSSTISSFIKEIHYYSGYPLDIEDPRNVLSKFEKLYQGQKVIFEEDDLPTCQLITDKLFIVSCPNYMKPDHLRCSEGRFNSGFGNPANVLNQGVEMCGINQYLKKPEFQTFTIITNKTKYICNIYAIYLSNVIREQIEKDPKIKQYVYDYDDEYDDFKLISSLFNFETVEITKSNMDALKEIAEDLQIQCILNDINKYINETEKVTQTIDDQQTIIDSINELFEWLYNIKQLTVKTVTKSIIESSWIETEESVQELVAFILEAVKTDILLHPYLVDLIIELNEQVDKSNYLNIMIPFLVDKLLSYICNDKYHRLIITNFKSLIMPDKKNSFICPFIYRLYKKDIIQKVKLIEIFKNYKFQDRIINAWFLPLFIEIDEKNINLILSNISSINFISMSNKINNEDPYLVFLKSYFPDKLDLYEKMLESGEPDDLITKSIRNDDVDTLQSIISRSSINVNQSFIPYNLYDEICQSVSNKMNYLNYAAAFGSIRCFKYLLLNHAQPDDKCFEFAIYGGHTEIIKIVEQQQQQNYLNIQTKPKFNLNFAKARSKSYSNSNLRFNYAIIKHRNDLFDYLFEKESINNNYSNSMLIQLTNVAANEGNAHVLAEIIDKGFDVSINFNQDVIQKALKNGFYKLSKFLKIIYNQKKDKTNIRNSGSGFNLIQNAVSSVFFGNLSIFQLFIKDFNQDNIESAISFAVQMDYTSIIDYSFKDLQKGEICFTENYLFTVLSASLNRETDKLFNSLLEKFVSFRPNLNITVHFFMCLLVDSCKYKNFEGVKTITDIILNKEIDADFSSAFSAASSVGSIQLCQFFVDKKVYMNYDKLKPNSLLNVELFSLIMNKVNYKLRPSFLNCIDNAIVNKNKELVEYLFKEKSQCKDALFLAVNTNDLDIVDIVLKYNYKPYFVNMISSNGTALTNAIFNKNLPIVKRLLSVPGINPGLYNSKLKYPLIIAIESFDLEIVNAILDFYGDDIKYQQKQLDEAFKKVFYLYCSETSRKVPKIIEVIKRVLEIKYIDPNYMNSKNNREYDDNDDDDYNDDYNDDNNNEINYYQIIEKNDEINFDFIDTKYKKNYNNDNWNNCTLLLSACCISDVEIVELLLKLDKIDVNQYSFITGYTPLMMAIIHNSIEIVNLLIKNPNTNINQRNFYDQTALTIAAQENLLDIIKILVNDERFDPEESRLNYAFSNSSAEITKELIKFDNIDINYQFVNTINIRNNKIRICYTCLTKAAKNNDVELIDLITHHPSFDKHKSLIENALIISIRGNSFDVFKKLLEIVDNDVNICDLNGKSLLIHAVSSFNDDFINYILENEKFDSKKSDILQAFANCYSCFPEFIRQFANNENAEFIEFEEDYEEDNGENTLKNLRRNYHELALKTMKRLLKYDKNHEKLIDFNRLLPDGNSFLTVISFSYPGIEKVVNFLLNNGVDINQQDAMKVYPLEKALDIGSINFVRCLMDTSKIDFNVKIPIKHEPFDGFESYFMSDDGFTTYFHLAVRSHDINIINLFIKKDLVGINAVDSNGNTPLMEICYSRSFFSFSIIEEFFKIENLDYLHRNNYGKDALEIYLELNGLNKEKNITDKDEYLKELKRVKNTNNNLP